MSETAPAPSAVGVLLAAGAGVQFGMPKVLAAEGRWLRVVVLGAAVVTVAPPARSVVAAGWADGLSASLKAGMAAIEHGADGYAVLHTVDTPDIGADVLRWVLMVARETASISTSDLDEVSGVT